MGKPVDSDDRHFSTAGDFEMALLTLENADIEYCSKSGNGPWEKGILISNYDT